MRLAGQRGWLEGLSQCFQNTVSASFTLIWGTQIRTFPWPQATRKQHLLWIPMLKQLEKQKSLTGTGSPQNHLERKSAVNNAQMKARDIKTDLNKGDFDTILFTAFCPDEASCQPARPDGWRQGSRAAELSSMWNPQLTPWVPSHALASCIPPWMLRWLVQRPQFPGQLAKQINTIYKELKKVDSLEAAVLWTHQDDSIRACNST